MPTIVDALSAERFGTYRAWASGDEALATRLYSFNVQLSAALYGPLHIFEVTLRNVVDGRLCGVFGPTWPDQPAVLPSFYQQNCIASARSNLRREGKAATHSQLVAELNFGFWSSLFGKDGTHLWGSLRPIFQAPGLQRGTISSQLRELRLLRNRVAHYEPIIGAPLAQRYASITTLAGYLSPSAAAWINKNSTWPAIYPGVPILTPDPTTSNLRLDPQALPFLPP